ncbi:MAG: signal peptide prediction [Burkholderiales bacterium]
MRWGLLLKYVRALLRYLWASPTTAIGLLLATLALAGKGRCRIVSGVLEVHGGLVAPLLRRVTFLPGGAAAITFGHVVLGRDQTRLDATRYHERVHVSQCERWGPLFLPVYVGASLWALARNRHPYRDNFFEREAFDAESGQQMG